MSTSRPALPIEDVLPQLVDTLKSSRSLVLRAPTGAGKTTRIPPALLDGLPRAKKIVLLEPRRVAARAAARRMAEELGTRLGEEVGYQIRFERRAGPKTRILVVTEGVLVGELQRDPFLENIGVVVFDEFHERNLQSDLALAMVRRVQREVRQDLKIVVMSATLDPGPVARYLAEDGKTCPVIESAGRLYPVEIHHLERPDTRRLETIVTSGIRSTLTKASGDVLVFLPGVGEIRRTADLLEPLARDQDLAVMPLYGDLPSDQQDAVLRPGARRKVVLATNVAETSITIDGVHAVVDAGLARVMRFDPASGLDRLELSRISRSSADQRAGRAGRQGPGHCLRLWTKHEDRGLLERDVPEIRRVDLAGPALQLLAWGESDLEAFEWFEAPESSVLRRSLNLLSELGAVGEHGLTSLGRQMATLPLHPRLARLVVAGHAAGQTERAAMLAALLSERDLVGRPMDASAARVAATSSSDLLDRLEALEDFAATGYGETPLGSIHRGRARHVLRVGQDLTRTARRVLGRETKQDTSDDEALPRALLQAYPDRLARRRSPGSDRALMVGGRGARLLEMSAVRDHELFLCLELDAGRGHGEAAARGEARVRQASGVERDWLPEADLRWTDDVEMNGERDCVVGRRRLRYRDLLLEESETAPSREDTERVLAEAAAENLEHALDLGREDVASFLTRLRCLAEWMPQLGLPRFESDELRALLPMLCTGKRSFAELRKVPLTGQLQGSLDYAQLEALGRHAPERLTVPSGNQIRLLYETGKPPVLAARIQELFGLHETPRVAQGRVPVMMHLLAPNMRPQQITQDLASFWTNTYPEIKKELSGRYPKHAWPEDPWNAEAQRRPRRRR